MYESCIHAKVIPRDNCTASECKFWTIVMFAITVLYLFQTTMSSVMVTDENNKLSYCSQTHLINKYVKTYEIKDFQSRWKSLITRAVTDLLFVLWCPCLWKVEVMIFIESLGSSNSKILNYEFIFGSLYFSCKPFVQLLMTCRNSFTAMIVKFVKDFVLTFLVAKYSKLTIYMSKITDLFSEYTFCDWFMIINIIWPQN